MLRWILIFEEYSPEMKYIKVDKYILVESLSRLPLNFNQDTAYNSTYQKGFVSEINDIE